MMPAIVQGHYYQGLSGLDAEAWQCIEWPNSLNKCPTLKCGL